MRFISASLLKDYIQCPKRAEYRMKFPEHGISTSAMTAGTIVHKVIEQAWDSITHAYKIAETELLSMNYSGDTKDIYKNIKNFFEIFQKDLSYDDKIEQFFKIQVSENLVITGKIDRIVEDKIIDWKTSKSIPTDLDTDLQFILYYIAYRKMYGSDPKKVLYASLYNRQYVEFYPNQNLINYVEKELLPEVNYIINNNAFPRFGLFSYPVKSGRTTYKPCTYCPFKLKCFEELQYE